MKVPPPAIARRRLAPGLSAKSRGKLRLALAVLAGFAAMAPSAFAASAERDVSEHVFTDWQGHTLQACITDVSGPDVYLQHRGELPFKVKISVFSKDDQAYIHNWSLNHPDANLPKVFRISALLSRPTTPTNPPEHGFKILLTNISGKEQGPYRIQYVLFNLPMPGATDHLPLARLNGETLIDALPPDSGTLVETSRMSGTSLRLAVWVRVYDASGALVQEWKSSPALASQSWDAVSGSADDTAPTRSDQSGG
jgi:hypothetical protein